MNPISLNIITKMTSQKEGGGRQMLTGLTKGGGGVGEMLTMADKGGRGVWTPQFLADIICEQPLTSVHRSFFLSSSLV